MRRCLQTLICLLPLAAHAAEPPPVSARRGMVVTAQHLASDVGAQILREGGNAVDAAVAVGYALAVVHPAAGNLGGGGFMTLRMADGRTAFLDFREHAPLAATRTMYLDEAGNVRPGLSRHGWLAVGVPGSPAGLEAARQQYGTMPREKLIAPALRLARDGYVLDPGDAALLHTVAPLLQQDAATAAIFLPGGTLPQAGQLLRQPQLAQSLEAISRNGPQAAFYRGPIAAAIIAASHQGGGILASADFAQYKVRWLPPIQCTYRGYTILSAPPPSSGGVTLCETLNILSGYNLTQYGFHSAAEIHVLVEALRHAFLDRNETLGDPAFVTNPVQHLLDPAYAQQVRAQIPPDHAPPPAAAKPGQGAEGTNTTSYAVVDAAGNAVSVTYTLNAWFGMGAVAGATGIVMNNEMDDFASKPGSPNMFGLVQGEANAIAPGKTPLSSMTPTILLKDGKLVAVLGSPGGPRIITAVLEAILNLVDHGMTVSEAVDAPRIHFQGLPDIVNLERFALSPDTRAILEREGYHFSDEDQWALDEAILAGSPSLSAPTYSPGALPMPQPYVEGAKLFGAHDTRGSSGAARGVD